MPKSFFRTLRIVLLALLAGCSSGGTGPTVDEVENPHTLVVQPGGGTLASLDGRARVNVPPGALAAATTLEVERLTSAEVPPLVAARLPIARVWRFGPERIEFASDVEVILRYDDLPAGVEISRLVMITIGPDGQLEILRDVVVTPTGARGVRALEPAAGGDVRGLISHFSPFAIVAIPSASGTYSGIRHHNPWTCSPSLPGYGEVGDFPLEVTVTQTGSSLGVLVDGEVVLSGTIDLDGRAVLHADFSISEPGFTGTETIDIVVFFSGPTGNLLNGTFTEVDTLHDLTTGTTHVCSSSGTLDLTRAG